MTGNLHRYLGTTRMRTDIGHVLHQLAQVLEEVSTDGWDPRRSCIDWQHVQGLTYTLEVYHGHLAQARAAYEAADLDVLGDFHDLYAVSPPVEVDQ